MTSDSVTDPIDIPTHIRNIRQQLGLTQEQFAAKLGITFPTVSRWENGHSKPSRMAVRLIENLMAEMRNQGKEFDGASIFKNEATTKD